MHLNVEVPLCVLDEPIEAIAEKVGASLEQWVEPGLGQARGFTLAGPAELKLRAEELVERPSPCPPGFTVYVEAAHLTNKEPELVLLNVLSALGAERSTVSWLQTERGCAAAVALLARTAGNTPSDA